MFCHVPKCSGTTVRYYAQEAYPSCNFFWLNREEEEIEQFFSRVARQPIEVLSNSFIGGHFTLSDFCKHFLPFIGSDMLDIIFSTSLRDPFERYCSHYEFHLRNPSSYPQSLDLLPTPSELSCQAGIYNTLFGMENRDIYCYYLLPLEYDNTLFCDDHLDLGQVKIHLCYVANSTPDFLFLSLIYRCRAIANGSTSNSHTLTRLRAMLDSSLSQCLKLNAHNAITPYAEKYPTEMHSRHEWFSRDYQLIIDIQSKMN